ncbi:hypothetical protein GQ43DRAFT_488880 [Delitschia confertaspora ATCC 74209]|uniref:Uncharacterized protein n=1 Tax=Delitschia confertaspora ATCC 74209 TaxID=1513339 RepID=A0A9P4JJS1_9PLEO|nr:hypothetical protein GQ43DRAFT_488880 [Delitschia confertaspora ATCC 74209]
MPSANINYIGVHQNAESYEDACIHAGSLPNGISNQNLGTLNGNLEHTNSPNFHESNADTRPPIRPRAPSLLPCAFTSTTSLNQIGLLPSPITSSFPSAQVPFDTPDGLEISRRRLLNGNAAGSAAVTAGSGSGSGSGSGASEASARNSATVNGDGARNGDCDVEKGERISVNLASASYYVTAMSDESV